MKRSPASSSAAAVAPNRPAAGSASSSDAARERALKLWVVLARTYDAIAQHTAADIARHGLTTTEFGILEALHHKGPLLLGEIQRKVLVTSGGITYLVDRLVAKGLVTREPSPDDRRARYAVLTAEGKQLIAQIFPAHAARLASVLSVLNEREQEQATDLLRKLGLGAAARSGEST